MGEDSSKQDRYGGYTETDYNALRLIELKQQEIVKGATVNGKTLGPCPAGMKTPYGMEWNLDTFTTEINVCSY